MVPTAVKAEIAPQMMTTEAMNKRGLGIVFMIKLDGTCI